MEIIGGVQISSLKFFAETKQKRETGRERKSRKKEKGEEEEEEVEAAAAAVAAAAVEATGRKARRNELRRR